MSSIDKVSMKELKGALADLNNCNAPKEKKDNVKNRLLGIATGFVMASRLNEKPESKD